MVPRPSALAAEFVPSRARGPPPAPPPRNGPPPGGMPARHAPRPKRLVPVSLAAAAVHAPPRISNGDPHGDEHLRDHARLDAALLLRAATGPGFPEAVNQYYALLPLERGPGVLSGTGRGGSRAQVLSIAYKAVSAETGAMVVLRRVLGGAPAHSAQIVRAVAVWKRVAHPGLVRVREVFTTRAFTAAAAPATVIANEVVVAYDFCPRAETLNGAYLSHDHHYSPVPEASLWSVATQLLAVTAAVHAAGLALRTALSPAGVLVTGLNRVRIARVALADAFDPDGVDHLPGAPGGAFAVHSAGATGAARMVAFQKEDLGALGRILLALATRSQAAQVRAGVLAAGSGAALDALQRSAVYTADFVHVVTLLLDAALPASRTVVRDVLQMIGPRLAVELGNVWTHADCMERQLCKEFDGSRLFRLTTLLGFVNERCDAATGDGQWAETGDRYLLKLFRDYVFHQVDESGRPHLDAAHVVESLNRLDVGSPERILLSSRDGCSVIAASYEDIRRCLMQAVEDLRSIPPG